MKIAELFHSIQGEGKLAGVPSVFVRASGCNLRCAWCDTPYASWDPEGENLPVERIVEQVEQFRTHHVVITGGEPLIMPEIESLCEALKSGGHHITIETAATVYKSVPVDLASLSPKLSNSTPRGTPYEAMHEQHRINPGVIQRFIDHSADFQIKFVVSGEGDLAEIHSLLDRLHGWRPEDVQLMPEGIDQQTLQSRASWIARACAQTGFRYSPRLHILLYGNKRGT